MKRLVLFAPLALAACNQPAPQLILPPIELATCEAEPNAPIIPERDGTAETQAKRDTVVLEYIFALVGAGSDCRGKVNGLNAWIDAAGG